MSVWLPVNACRTACAADAVPAVDAATRHRRWVRAAHAVTTGVVRTGYVPG
jgi:hypothetical protein